MKAHIQTALIALSVFLVWVGPAVAQTDLTGYSFCLDPGHGYNTNRGYFGYPEAQKVLRVARHMREFLMAAGADTVILTRDTDNADPTLSQRESIANYAGVDWFHSIHSNAGGEGTNNVLVLYEEIPFSGETPEWPDQADVVSELMSAWVADGYRIPNLGAFGDWTFYGGPTGGFNLGVLNDLQMPGQLSEGGFHSNREQNLLNMNAESRRLEGLMLAYSFFTYFDLPFRPLNILLGIVSDEDDGRPLNGVDLALNTEQTYTTDTYAELFSEWCRPEDQCGNGFYYFEGLELPDYTLTLSADGYYDTTLKVTMADSFLTFLDVELVSSIPPAVVATDPAEGDTAASILRPVTFEFSRAMRVEGFESGFHISPEVAGALAWEEDDHRLRFVPAAPLPFDTWFVVKIDSTVRDRRGHELDGNGDGTAGDSFVLRFKTSAEDRFPPVLMESYPDDGQPQVPVDAVLSFRFNEWLDASRVTASSFFLVDAFQEVVDADVTYHAIGFESVVNLYPRQRLLPEVDYQVTITPAVSDIFGNRLSRGLSVSFTTSAQVPELRSVDDFEAGVESWASPSWSGSTQGIVPEETIFTAIDSLTNLSTGSTRAAALVYSYQSDVIPDSTLIRVHTPPGSPTRITFTPDDVLQIYIFGDGSGSRFRFHVDEDAGGPGEVSLWRTIDWLGWRLVQWDLASEPPGEWLAESDGVLVGSLTFDSMQFAMGDGLVRRGILFVDDLRVGAVATGVADRQPDLAIPARFELSQAHPNPARAGAGIIIGFGLPRASQVRIDVYNLLGQHMETLVDEQRPAGMGRVVWNAMDESGLPAAAGAYLLRMRAGEFEQTRKLMILR